jgi:UDP-MurNAc hydroxylase
MKNESKQVHPTKIQFLNHASVRISSGETSIACDPWYTGAAFNDGWNLLVEDPRAAEYAKASKFIWVSHEHPDHFSIDFFKNSSPKSSTILFQNTKDKRVFSYFKKNQYKIEELNDGSPFALSKDETFTVGKNGFYDSWSLYQNSHIKVLNLNDCDFTSTEDLVELKKIVGEIDVLITQFSYAAWKGGKSNASLRELAARQKLEAMSSQLTILKPKYFIPFASFSYFSHVENSYLSDSVNTIDKVFETFKNSPSKIIILRPIDEWEVGADWNNDVTRDFWRKVYENRSQLPLNNSRKSYSLGELEKNCKNYQEKIFKNNSKMFMQILSWLPVISAFRPLNIRLTDLGVTVQFSFFSILKKIESEEIHLSLSSESLNFIFTQDFGYDTLTVNGRFEASPEGFGLTTKNFAIGSLNTMGLSLSPSFLLRLDVAFLLLKRLTKFTKRIRETAKPNTLETSS